jgi:hypothetical protein
MSHEAPFLVALGMLVAAALVVGVSGWMLFARERALPRAATGRTSALPDDAHHPGAAEGR